MYACSVCVSVCVRDYERYLDLFVCNCYCCLFTRMDGMWLWIWYGSLVCVAMRASFSMWMWETNECCLRCTFWRLFLVNKSDMCMDEYIQMLILTYRWTLNICVHIYFVRYLLGSVGTFLKSRHRIEAVYKLYKVIVYVCVCNAQSFRNFDHKIQLIS